MSSNDPFAYPHPIPMSEIESDADETSSDECVFFSDCDDDQAYSLAQNENYHGTLDISIEQLHKGMSPIKDPNMIDVIYNEFLALTPGINGKRNGAIWKIGCALGLRISDLLTLRLKDFKENSITATFLIIKEKKKRKSKHWVNATVTRKVSLWLKVVVQEYCDAANVAPNDYLFYSRKRS
ncbi:hypothetical protein GEMRC1_000292 [Eukaryota sp. GEM-RC1]